MKRISPTSVVGTVDSYLVADFVFLGGAGGRCVVPDGRGGGLGGCVPPFFSLGVSGR